MKKKMISTVQMVKNNIVHKIYDFLKYIANYCDNSFQNNIMYHINPYNLFSFKQLPFHVLIH